MALQGNIETFALPDVLRLLASTSKTGKLRLEGSRGEGVLFVAGGALVAGHSTATGPSASTEVLFELLRFDEGDFVFDQDETTDDAGEPVDVESALGEAEAMLEEWRQLESVVPSLDAWLVLADELPGEEVTLDRERWSHVVAIGGGRQAQVLADELELGELGVLRLVKELVDLGIVAVTTEAPATAAPSTTTSVPDEAAALEAEADEAEGAGDSSEGISFADMPSLVDEAPAAEPEVDGGFDTAADDSGLPPLMGLEDEPRDEGLPAFEDAPGLAVVPDEGDEPGDLPAFDTAGLLADEQPAAEDDSPADAAEIAKQLANLSPKAAKAVAAAAKATTDEEREEALAALEGEDTSLNRDLLLKFLGSVNS